MKVVKLSRHHSSRQQKKPFLRVNLLWPYALMPFFNDIQLGHFSFLSAFLKTIDPIQRIQLET